MTLSFFPEPLSAEEQTALFKEIRADEAAGKLEDAHGTAAQKEAWRKMLEEKAKAPAAGNAKVRGMALDDLRADVKERSAVDERHKEQGK